MTLLDPKGALSFRGQDAVLLSGHPFEAVAALVWDVPGTGPWSLTADERDLVVRARESG